MFGVVVAALAVAQTVDPLSAEDLDALSARLAPRVAEIRIVRDVPDDHPLLLKEEVAYGVALDASRVVCVAQLLDHAETIRVRGPAGEVLADVALDDRDRRVAILKTREPLSSVGLAPSPPLARDAREMDAPVFARIAATGDATALSGVITDPGYKLEHDGLPTTSLKLTRGMPVFDVELRWVGLARTLPWDANPFLLIPPELVDAALVAAEPPPAPAEPDRPWWAKEP